MPSSCSTQCTCQQSNCLDRRQRCQISSTMHKVGPQTTTVVLGTVETAGLQHPLIAEGLHSCAPCTAFCPHALLQKKDWPGPARCSLHD